MDESSGMMQIFLCEGISGRQTKVLDSKHLLKEKYKIFNNSIVKTVTEFGTAYSMLLLFLYERNSKRNKLVCCYEFTYCVPE